MRASWTYALGRKLFKIAFAHFPFTWKGGEKVVLASYFFFEFSCCCFFPPR